MKCPKCGANNPDNSEFCNSCGAGLKGKLNPALHKDAKAEFIAEIKKIYI